MKLRKIEPEKKSEEKSEKIEGFGNYILHDRNNVMGILITLSRWMTFFVTVVGAIIAWMYDYNTLAIVLGVLSAFFAKAIYKFYKLGGRKATVGMNANDLIYKSKYKLGDTSGNERKNDTTSHGSGTDRVQEDQRELQESNSSSEREYFGANYDIRVTESNGFKDGRRDSRTKD